jgi:four helix bundle protein
VSLQSDHLKKRTLAFAVQILRVVDNLPRTPACQAIGRQLARSGAAVGANYRAACSARSRREFIAKLGVVVEEAEESVYWLDVISAAGMARVSGMESLRTEAAEILAIFAKSIGTARANANLANSDR